MLVTSRPIASFLFLGPGVDLSRLDVQSLLFSHWENKNNIDFDCRGNVSGSCYCWWKKSCTTWHAWNPANSGINYLWTGAGFLPPTVLRKPFISDPGCDAGGFEVLDLGRVINSNLMGKARMGDDVMMAMFGGGIFYLSGAPQPPWRKTRKGLRVSKMKGEPGSSEWPFWGL